MRIIEMYVVLSNINLRIKILGRLIDTCLDCNNLTKKNSKKYKRKYTIIIKNRLKLKRKRETGTGRQREREINKKMSNVQ